MDSGLVILYPVEVQLDAFKAVLEDKMFWLSYANTLFVTFYGTIWAMFISVTGAYALSKSRLIFRRGFNFLLVFTMWFNAGMIPQYINYVNTRNVFHSIGITDDKWVVVIAMGLAAFNIIILRNAFEGVPKEIEEAAIVDGANDFQVLTKVYIPMTKAAMATVTLFYGLSRWNGYFWARQIISNSSEWPLQVYIRRALEDKFEAINYGVEPDLPYTYDSLFYAMIVCAIIPIIIIYPYIQKYFARGVNLGGVKE
jgi:putative aldouronate transport system permease protein